MRKKNENFRQVMPQKKCRNILEIENGLKRINKYGY